MTWSAIIAGAGSGTRLGANIPKALVHLGGTPLIVHAVQAMNNAGIADCIVTVPDGYLDEFRRVFNDAGLEVRLTLGGSTRQESVALGLALVTTDAVLVHDAARALTPVSMIQRVIQAIDAGAQSAIPALPVVDTIKRVSKQGRVSETLLRHELQAVQTPQGFLTPTLRRAHDLGNQPHHFEANAAPDDAALVELIGEEVVVVPGAYEALKITTPFDLSVAELLLTQSR
ncbi:2-C-methyl-D-erythritol 4-phosphate cytidylyltransferase [Arcanobacterium pinnipediorum]|uniref:2-C-methyl-D-erythritol 4-phosphate cytidylyltransferase n=1 Tax=Arcanobacterium pinnipediorum TaxID=1503041 RepID=A0ABY5AH90_9ACTO|nr:2-C-methyl-D-erythritol 4-phosphate cytidylyltransferase [Arcanobacterium pinnipediorum]USR79288.1 2-C-methyl-D-erythritol 4-phosphate cytidylyltransferase [Arcanobacterium pinnipediorum]